MPSRLKARDLMTPDVVTVPPETPILAMARLLADRGISAVPVVGADGTLQGIVTEADLIRRLADEDVEHRPGWFSRMFTSPGTQADHYARTHGARARDVMTPGAIAVGLDDTAAHIAALMESKKIRRVLVVEDGRLRGIVSRADMLRALVAPPAEGEAMSDEHIRRAVMDAMKREPWANSFYLMADVRDGVVIFHGFMRDTGVARGLRALAESVPGVKAVRDETQPMPSYLY